MVAIAKETTEATVLVVDGMTAGVVDLTAGVTAGAIANLLTAVKWEAVLTKAADETTAGVAVMTAIDGMTAGVADMTATGVAAMVVIGVMAAGMTAGVTAEATIALAVVIAMKGGQKTEDLPIAMVSFELTF
jgi:hypothetical protein